jgi:hypothetical protein
MCHEDNSICCPHKGSRQPEFVKVRTIGVVSSNEQRHKGLGGRDMNPEKQKLVDFICGQSLNEEVINMDCNECCEQLTCIAEQVAAGAKLSDIMPELEEHFRCWPDSREEFYALVTVIRAEQAGMIENE